MMWLEGNSGDSQESLTASMLVADAMVESVILTRATTVHSVEVKEDSISVIYRTPSDLVYANGKRAPDKIRECVYGFEGGKVVIKSESFGVLHHAETIIVPERIEMREPLD